MKKQKFMNKKITEIFVIISIILMCITILLFVIGICFFDTNELLVTIVKLSIVGTVISFSVFFILWAFDVLINQKL